VPRRTRRFQNNVSWPARASNQYIAKRFKKQGAAKKNLD
jgi:hypothetical protein